MEPNELIELATNALKPILMAAGTAAAGSVPIIIKSYAGKISKSIETKNELESLTKVNEQRETLMKQIGISVKAAVASNMQAADKMKSGGNKLSDDQVDELQRNAKQLALDSLPESLTTKDGVLNNIIGGNDRLNSIIDGYLEQYVYEYKNKNN